MTVTVPGVKQLTYISTNGSPSAEEHAHDDHAHEAHAPERLALNVGNAEQEADVRRRDDLSKSPVNLARTTPRRCWRRR